MKYRISKLVGWIFLIMSFWVVFLNYTKPKIYLIVIFSGAWVFLASAWGAAFRYHKEVLLCLQSGAVSLLGYRVVERWSFVFHEKTIGGIGDEGSPLAFLLGSGLEIFVLSMLLASLIEVVITKTDQ